MWHLSAFKNKNCTVYMYDVFHGYDTVCMTKSRPRKKSECFQDLSQDYTYLAILVIIYIARSDCKVLQVYSVYIHVQKS